MLLGHILIFMIIHQCQLTPVSSHPSLIFYPRILFGTKIVLNDFIKNMPNKFTSDQDEILVMLYMYKKFTNRFFVDKQIQEWLYDNYNGFTIGVPDCMIFNNHGTLTDQYWNCRMIQVCRSYNMKHLEKMIIDKLNKSLTFLINMKDFGKKINFTTLKFDIVIWIPTKLYNDAFDFIDIIEFLISTNKE